MTQGGKYRQGQKTKDIEKRHTSQRQYLITGVSLAHFPRNLSLLLQICTAITKQAPWHCVLWKIILFNLNEFSAGQWNPIWKQLWRRWTIAEQYVYFWLSFLLFLLILACKWWWWLVLHVQTISVKGRQDHLVQTNTESSGHSDQLTLICTLFFLPFFFVPHKSDSVRAKPLLL